jgi:hypothetical protein
LDLWEDLGHFSKGSGVQPPAHALKFQLPDKTIVETDLVFIALDRPQSVKKIRGSQLTGCWLNELKELPKAVIDMLDFRIGRYPSAMDGGPSWFGMIGDTNQVDDDHWLYELQESVKPEGWSFFTQPGGLVKNKVTGDWEENPLAENVQNLPEGYYIKGKEGKLQSWISVNLGNQYGTVEDGRPVYKEQFLDTLHVNPTVTYVPGEPIVVGLDFGLTPSAIITQATTRGGVNVLKEVVAQDMGIRQFVEYLLAPVLARDFEGSDKTFIGDPAGNQQAQTDQQTVFKELADMGILCETANTNKLEPRLEAVRYYLGALRDGKPAFQVHPSCVTLRKGFNGGYKFRRLQVVGDERFTDIPDKNKYSHVHDALQYVCLHHKGAAGYSQQRLAEVSNMIHYYTERRMSI